MSDWSSIHQGIANLHGRKADARNRFSGSLQNLSSLLYNKGENARQREFEGSENQKTRTYMDTPFPDGPREYSDPTTGQTFSYSTPREWDALLQGQSGAQSLLNIQTQGDIQGELQSAEQTWQKEMQDDAQAFNLELSGIENTADMDRLQAQLDAQIAERERMLTQPRELYPDGSRSATVAGRSYTWNSDQEYELVQLQMQSDLLKDRITLEQSLEGTDSSSRNRILDAYTFGKDEVLNPSVYNQETGAWQSMADINPDQLEQQFRDAIALYNLSDDETERAVNLFMGWIERIPAPDPDAYIDDDQRLTMPSPWVPGTGAVTGGIEQIPLTNNEPSEAVLETYSDMPKWVYGGAEPPRTYYPIGVTESERSLYDQLVGLRSSQPENGTDIQVMLDRLSRETITPDMFQQWLDEMLNPVTAPRTAPTIRLPR